MAAHSIAADDVKRILVIRNDNIGDLVCTTPMIHRLRSVYPKAWIGVLANEYNAEVLRGNADIDDISRYLKAKHRPDGRWKISVWLDTAWTLLKLRRKRIDLLIIASTGGHRFARWIGARQILAAKGSEGHEVERCMALLRPLAVPPDSPGPVRLIPDALTRNQLAKHFPPAAGPLIGLHLSARKPSQRWPEARFVELCEAIHRRHPSARIVLFWSPGSESNPTHPGDDDKAMRISAAVQGLPVFPMPTGTLRELIAATSLCDSVICADGGTMHIAAGLNKPIVCLFGNSGLEQWHPWGVNYHAIQPESLDVSDILVTQVLEKLENLLLNATG